MSGSIDSGEKDVYDDINITPMLDLAYVLMVIFIIMTTASVQGIKVNLPKASDTPSLAKPQTKAITITADGTMYLDTYPVSLPELENLLRQYKAAIQISRSSSRPIRPCSISASSMCSMWSGSWTSRSLGWSPSASSSRRAWPTSAVNDAA